ncbi:uncharacterized protein [Chiloscyllium punctatum]|uniref:uncharacterized protein n=1 Tax=Chiloscyllium punctatum TaxID=137246 RepID=UPI003B63EB47
MERESWFTTEIGSLVEKKKASVLMRQDGHRESATWSCFLRQRLRSAPESGALSRCLGASPGERSGENSQVQDTGNQGDPDSIDLPTAGWDNGWLARKTKSGRSGVFNKSCCQEACDQRWSGSPVVCHLDKWFGWKYWFPGNQESPDSIAFPAAGWIVHHLIECSWSARERQRERRSGAFNKFCSEVFLMSLTQQNSQFLSRTSPH